VGATAPWRRTASCSTGCWRDAADGPARSAGIAALPSPSVTAVLFTCAGQRVDIVTAFRRAGATTVAADADALAPALYRADRMAIVPRIDDPAYVRALAATVAEHDVRLVVPLSDLDQTILSLHREELAPALVLAPSADVCRTMGDKYLAHLFFVAHEIESPRTWLVGEVPADAQYPLLVKVREGFGSRHIYRAADERELEFFLGYTTVDSMVQEVCVGEEFSIDVFSDLDGVCLNAIPRTMIQSKGGESIKGMSIRDDELIEYGARVAEQIGVVGPANIQCFREPDGRLPVTDVNLRFGGAFPLPLAAGSRYPELALALAAGERPERRLGAFREGVVMTRFFSDLCLTAGPDGTLDPFAEELPAPLAPGAGEA
jgi:carbamoyl-phosphate synthase large subunit